MYRIGHGYDIHRFCDGRPLLLGGVEIPYKEGLDGHSDADVLLHSLCNAMLGASGRGDIGEHFPPTDKSFKDIRSSVLVKRVLEMIEADYNLMNVDFSIIAEEPKLMDWKKKIKSNVARLLDVELERVNVKAGTNEKMGSIGSCKGIAVHCAVLLKKRNK